MNIKAKKPIKLTPKKISYFLTACLIGLIILIMTCVSGFLYKNFYQMITQADEIIILREKVALDTISLEKFNLIIGKLESKTAPKESIAVTDPFKK